VNPRQRRGAFLMVLAALAAVALFITVTRYVSSVNSQIAPTVTVYQAADDLQAYATIDAASIEKVEIPRKYAPKSAIADAKEVIGRRVSFNIASGTYLGSDMILPPSSLNQNEREIALTVDSKTGIAGRVRSGDFVDVYAVFGEEGSGTSRVLVRSVRVVSVGGVETRREPTSRDELDEQQVVPVTLALEPDDALRVTYADAFALSVRLVGLPPGIQNDNRSKEPSGVDTETLRLPEGE
jgi:pilus assembly protein CpaB